MKNLMSKTQNVLKVMNLKKKKEGGDLLYIFSFRKMKKEEIVIGSKLGEVIFFF